MSSRKGSSDITGKVVVVAVKASKEISRTALVWALNHVAQPGDCIKMLVVIPAICSNTKIWGLPKLAADCITSHWISRLGTVSDQREVSVNSCSQMVLQLHDFYDPEKIKIRVKILSSSVCGAVAAEAKRVQSSWVILDKKLKNEKKYCMEELSCNVVIMKRSGPNVLRLNLTSSPNMELKGGCPLSSKLNAFPRNFKDKSEHPDMIRGPIVTSASSSKLGSNLTSTNVGTSSTLNDSESEDLSLSSRSSYFQPWISNAICIDGDISKEDIMLRSSDEALVSINKALHQKFSKLDQDPNLGVLRCKLDVNLSRSVREAISQARSAPHGTPPLCSICQHSSPVFGNPPRWFTFAELQHATCGFSQANFLAEGGFGSVHRGVLRNGQVIAVKQYKVASTQGDKDFCSEVEVLSCAQHRNVVMLIGFCVENGRRLLVYEYICNGSLYSHLHGQKQNVLEWSARKKIAVGTARGLRYLHEECRVGCIVHRDMRPNNILLTHDFEALVGDFGLARWQPDGEMGVQSRVIGTLGYLAPEYTLSGEITEKADVYSFGVVLLELITGRKAMDVNRPKGQQCLHEWARPLLEVHAIDELVDPSIRNCAIDKEVHRMLQCSSLCIQQDPHSRPRMSQVLRMLEG
ncbi:inactive protein kinase SELMODRAFT_444075-like [Gastrolobium bilobum]|uniref:inactive protein kinase SELMODRAFT_444075-like n=1 Tax=Gastrolobium bilobum TaxID=150636 RepID=UPI002AAFD710|nr:inactive protein kinase SELMODRAFT_444075-like [Gastrolobium bilobum]